MAFDRLTPMLNQLFFVIATDEFVPKRLGRFRALNFIGKPYIMTMGI